MPVATLARHAMNTRFEIVLHGLDPVRLRAAGEEALAEIERLEDRMSFFRPSSEVARINRRAAFEPVRVTPEIFRLLQLAQRLHRETGGAFDITIAPLLRCWGFRTGAGVIPAPEALAEARAQVGMEHVVLDERTFTVRFNRPCMQIDLGGIGKGFAIDQAVEILREAGVSNALLHGGTSTAYAFGCNVDGQPWKIGIPCPAEEWDRPSPVGSSDGAPADGRIFQHGDSDGSPEAAPEKLLAAVPLEDASISLSAVWGRFFRNAERIFGHVLDPRTGEPVAGALLAAVVCPSAAETDALSTALLTLGAGGLDTVTALRPGLRALVVGEQDGRPMVRTRGIEIHTGAAGYSA